MNIIPMTFVAPPLAWARRDEGRYPQQSLTEEQQRPKPKATQPSGRQVFLRQTSWLAPHRPLRVCSSLAPRLAQQSLAANVIVFMFMTTKARPALPRHLTCQYLDPKELMIMSCLRTSLHCVLPCWWSWAQSRRPHRGLRCGCPGPSIAGGRAVLCQAAAPREQCHQPEDHRI